MEDIKETTIKNIVKSAKKSEGRTNNDILKAYLTGYTDALEMFIGEVKE